MNATNPSAGQTAHNEYIPALDGLRGIAILLVISYHYLGLHPVFSFGWCGVDLFFVLSGYLITQRLLANASEPNRYALFYRNRMLRIIPLYFLVLIVFFAVIFFFKSPEGFVFYRKYWPYFFVFLQNWVFIFKGYPTELYFRHLWSIAVEEQFYLLWPFIVYLLSYRFNIIKLTWGLLVITLLVRIAGALMLPANYDYYSNTFFRADAFLVGALLYLTLQHAKLPAAFKAILYAAPLIVIAHILFYQSARHYAPYWKFAGFTALAFSFALLVYSALTCAKTSVWSRFLTFKPLLLTGKLSYGLYIFHWPMLLLVNDRLYQLYGHVTANGSLARGLSLLSTFGLSFCLSYLSYRYYEIYFLRKKRYKNAVSSSIQQLPAQ